MDVLLILLGMLVGAIGLVMIIVNLIRKKPVKKYGATLLIGMVLLVTGGIMLDTDEEKSKEEPKTKVENVKETSKSSEAKENSKKEIKEEPKKDKGRVKLDSSTPKREFTVGKSDKNFLEITDTKPGEVRNDVTGKWRKVRIAESVDINEYLLSYNKLYMTEDSSAVHIIFNFTYKTTTVINDFGSYLSVNVYEYVDKEEHDAKKIGTGLHLGEYKIYKDNGDIVDWDKVIEAEKNED